MAGCVPRSKRMGIDLVSSITHSIEDCLKSDEGTNAFRKFMALNFKDELNGLNVWIAGREILADIGRMSPNATRENIPKDLQERLKLQYDELSAININKEQATRFEGAVLDGTLSEISTIVEQSQSWAVEFMGKAYSEFRKHLLKEYNLM